MSDPAMPEEAEKLLNEALDSAYKCGSAAGAMKNYRDVNEEFDGAVTRQAKAEAALRLYIMRLAAQAGEVPERVRHKYDQAEPPGSPDAR